MHPTQQAMLPPLESFHLFRDPRTGRRRVTVTSPKLSRGVTREAGQPWAYTWNRDSEQPTPAEIAEAERIVRETT
jgi:hypothetical protein